MRFLCACVVEHEGTFQKKVEMIEVKEKDFAIASNKVAELISAKYNIPNKFVDREPEQVGILYINPKKEHKRDDLCDLDIDKYDGLLDDESEIIWKRPSL